jgi:hypothetical protein
MTGGHSFKARFLARAYGWHGSALASKRLKEAFREINSVAKSDRVLAAEGCVSLMERLWSALEEIDASSGAFGGAVHRKLDELMPTLISAPADVKTRSAWLERLFQSVMDGGVQYLAPVEDRWGEIAVYPEFLNEYAERLRIDPASMGRRATRRPCHRHGDLSVMPETDGVSIGDRSALIFPFEKRSLHGEGCIVCLDAEALHSEEVSSVE